MTHAPNMAPPRRSSSSTRPRTGRLGSMCASPTRRRGCPSGRWPTCSSGTNPSSPGTSRTSSRRGSSGGSSCCKFCNNWSRRQNLPGRPLRSRGHPGRGVPGEVPSGNAVPHVGYAATPGVHRQRLHPRRRTPQTSRREQLLRRAARPHPRHTLVGEGVLAQSAGDLRHQRRLRPEGRSLAALPSPVEAHFEEALRDVKQLEKTRSTARRPAPRTSKKAG